MLCLDTKRTPLSHTLLIKLLWVIVFLHTSVSLSSVDLENRQKRSFSTPGLTLVIPASPQPFDNKSPDEVPTNDQLVKRDYNENRQSNRPRFDYNYDHGNHINPQTKEQEDGNLLNVGLINRRSYAEGTRGKSKAIKNDNFDNEEAKEEDYNVDHEKANEESHDQMQIDAETLHLLEDIIEYSHMHDLKDKHSQYNRRFKKLARFLSKLKKRNADSKQDNNEKDDSSEEESDEEDEEDYNEEEDVNNQDITENKQTRFEHKSQRRETYDGGSSKTFVGSSQKLDLVTVTGIAFVICGVVITLAYWLTLRPPKPRLKGREQTKVVRSSSDFEI